MGCCFHRGHLNEIKFTKSKQGKGKRKNKLRVTLDSKQQSGYQESLRLDHMHIRRSICHCKIILYGKFFCA